MIPWKSVQHFRLAARSDASDKRGMLNYNSCPSCDRKEKGFTIYACTNCGFEGCFRKLREREGCWKDSDCPKCSSPWTFTRKCGRIGGIAPDGTNHAVVELGLNFTGTSGTVTGWFDGFILNVL